MEKYLSTSYLPLIEKYEDELKLMCNKCKDCGKVAFPAFERCPFCGSNEVEKHAMPEIAEVKNLSTLNLPVGPYKPPVVMAYVESGDAKFIARLGCSPDQVKKGDKVKLKFRNLYEEQEYDMKTKEIIKSDIVGFEYVPLNGGE